MRWKLIEKKCPENELKFNPRIFSFSTEGVHGFYLKFKRIEM